MLAARYDELLDAADAAIDRLRAAMTTGRDAAELRKARAEAETALLDAANAAEAGRRRAAGLATYGDRIALRKALARPDVDAWSKRLVELRTRREALKLQTMSTLGALLPNSVRIDDTGAYGPHIFGLEALPGTLRAGVDVRTVVDRTTRDAGTNAV